MAAVLAGSIAFVVAVGNPVDWIDKRVSQLSQRTRRQPARPVEPLLLPERRHAAPRDLAGGAARRARAPAARRGRRRLSLQLSARAAPGHPDLGSAMRTASSSRTCPSSAFRGCCCSPARSGRPASGRCGRAGWGPSRRWLSIIALTAGAYWLAHASLDWFWPYPALTAPVFALLGSACAPALRIAGDAPRGRGRRWLTAGAVVLAISAVPPYLSHRYVNDAYDEWRSDPSRRLRRPRSGRALNPLSVDPVLAEGAIARAERGSRPGDRRIPPGGEQAPRGMGVALQPGGALCPELASARPPGAGDRQAAQPLRPRGLGPGGAARRASGERGRD